MAKLDKSWDEDIAKDLFWEKLHHQEDLYPVTFAAFPWLWRFSGRESHKNTDILDFLSFTMKCARSSLEDDGATGTEGKFRGLSLSLSDHQKSWIPEHCHMTNEDMGTLAALEDWYSANCGDIANICVDAVDGNNDYLDAILSVGYASLHGGDAAAGLIIGWADKLEPEEILEYSPLQSWDVSALSALSKLLRSKNDRLAGFLDETVGPHLTCEKTERFL
ncbi:hypothetical protein [Roseibium sp. RKSG952]|uniref:hypothetical protein n=1 Tax=Roseibium sp. RKSG952 TaxID=2529384 RepID=UPI0012BC59A7|nr:hypothetical protein [Roseibium sp. RKSG952]MTH98711.1 hypothetical protein [Roseibium sp. RKSG952]